MGESDNKKLTTKLCRSGIHSTASRRKLGKLERCHGRTTRLLCSPMLLCSQWNIKWWQYCQTKVLSRPPNVLINCDWYLQELSSEFLNPFEIKVVVWSYAYCLGLWLAPPVSVSISVSLPLSRNNTCLAHCITLMQLQYTNSICWCWCSMHLMFAKR